MISNGNVSFDLFYLLFLGFGLTPNHHKKQDILEFFQFDLYYEKRDHTSEKDTSIGQ